MSENLRLLRQRLDHLGRMSAYLAWSLAEVERFSPIQDLALMSPEQHESLAALRVRFSDFQEHLGKSMRAIAREEEQPTEPFGAVLALMEKLEILDTAEHWKLIRELRNAINHEYEEDSRRLSAFFENVLLEAPVLLGYLERMQSYCQRAYPEIRKDP